MNRSNLAEIAVVIMCVSSVAILFAYWAHRLWFRNEVWMQMQMRFMKERRYSILWWINLISFVSFAILFTAMSGIFIGKAIRSEAPFAISARSS